jgi:sugar phosphate isomerase/epimerase
MKLGINLCFAVKRLTEPQAWAEFVRTELDLDAVQFSFDLLDPWWPEAERRAIIRRTRAAADAWGLDIGSAYVGSAHYVPAGLLDPDPEARSIARRWWRRACEVAGELGVSAVGGPLGTLSVREAADPLARAQRYRDLLDSLEAITTHAAAAGLGEFLIEPTHLAREIPSTIGQCQHLLDGLRDRCPIPPGITLDIGHAVFEPRYGPRASAESWITGLGAGIRMLHVDNTDRHSDPHWGWPHERGRVDLAPIAASIRAAGLDSIPAILEIRPRFEDDDEEVRRNLAASVAYCRQHLGAAAAER